MVFYDTLFSIVLWRFIGEMYEAEQIDFKNRYACNSYCRSLTGAAERKIPKNSNKKEVKFRFFKSEMFQPSSVWAIDIFVYMMTSSKRRPGTILENLYPPQNFVPVFLSTAVWSLESQFP